MSNKPLYILDMDRTIVDVNKVMDVTKIACDEFGIDFDQIYKDQKDLQAKGTAYSPFKYISEHPGTDIEAFNDRFCELATTGLLFDDAIDLLNDIKSMGNDFMFLTHGVDDNWQELKMRAAGLIDDPYIIVKDRYKSRFINTWIEDGVINPGLQSLGLYRAFVFVDDREEAFIDFPSHSGKGYLIDRFSRFEDSITLPNNVKKIKNLSEVII